MKKNTESKISFTDVLREAFFDGTIKGGQPLTEESLSKIFGVSRTPVREALIHLEHEGLVTIIKNKGAFVREITPTDVVEIFQLRILLESYAARVCLDYLDLNQLQELYDELKAITYSGETESYVNKLGQKLHRMITDSTPNERFRNLVGGLYSQFVRARNLAHYIPGRSERSMRQHLKIAETLLAGNPAGAERAMRQHIHSTMKEIVAPANIRIFSLVNYRP